MGTILKANRYRIVDNSAFEMALPLRFTIYKAEAPVAEYIISEDEQVTYKILTKFKELMITTIQRPLDISDIYYLFSCRVFQDRTPFTYPVLKRMGLEKYNVCAILERTHGITPYDDYWLRFDGEKLSYEEAVEEFDKYLIAPELQPVPVVSYPNGAVPAEISKDSENVSAILNQHKIDVAGLMEESKKPVQIAPEHSYEPAREVENNKMSEDEIESLLQSVGLDGEKTDDASVPVEPVTRSESSPDDDSSGGKMSQEDIEKLLAASAPAPEPEPAPAEPAPSGGKMSQDDIEALLNSMHEEATK